MENEDSAENETLPPSVIGGYGNPLKQYVDKQMPIRRKLEIRIKLKEDELKELREALSALDDNPQYEKLHDTLTKVSRFL